MTNVRSRNETPFPAFIGIDPRPRILKKSLKGRRLRIILARVVSAQRQRVNILVYPDASSLSQVDFTRFLKPPQSISVPSAQARNEGRY